MRKLKKKKAVYWVMLTHETPVKENWSYIKRNQKQKKKKKSVSVVPAYLPVCTGKHSDSNVYTRVVHVPIEARLFRWVSINLNDSFDRI